nr:MAG: replication associated protein [Cressdnaviricota sp.]
MTYQVFCNCKTCFPQHPVFKTHPDEYRRWCDKTNNPKTRQMTQERGNYWSVTFFNGEQNGSLPAKWKLEGQLEIAPATGKEHYQGMLHTPQVRFSAIKKAFPKAHIELARDPEALQQYVHKKATRKTDKEVSEYAEHMKINRTKFFEDVLEFMFNNVYDSCLNAITEDSNYAFLTETVNSMVEAGGDWAYCSMAVQPITRCIWRDYRVAMWNSFVASHTNQNADDNEVSWNEDTGDVPTVAIECVGEEGTDEDESTQASADDSDGEDDKASDREDE